tara:strand:+ start:13775 stop:14452 length:678 start_codon:yes stop_codon:yes gene_type:complete
MKQIFKNRQEAGLLLAAQISLLPKADLTNAIVLALPRGGVPVAREISKKLEIPFDVLIVRKIGHPFHPEYGIGAVTENEILWMDPEAVGLSKITLEQITSLQDHEKEEVQRRANVYRKGRPVPELKNKTVILVDDGLATGATARAAGLYAKSKGAAKIILAIPICSGNTAQRLRSEIDHVICMKTPIFFQSVGEFYRNFEQLTDDEVLNLLSHQTYSSDIPNFKF